MAFICYIRPSCWKFSYLCLTAIQEKKSSLQPLYTTIGRQHSYTRDMQNPESDPTAYGLK